jgi:hypothetical protein
MTWHSCDHLPPPEPCATLITRCAGCGAFWRRVYRTYDGYRWKPVNGFSAWRLRRRFAGVKP